MTVTYSDIIHAMIDADRSTDEIDTVVLTDESMDTFLRADNFTEATEARMEETIGREWTLALESGDENYLRLENGSHIQIG